MKKNILFLILGTIIFSGITAYAAIKYQASEIEYNNTQLDEVLDDLYSAVNSSGVRICKYQGNEYGDSNDHYSLGTEYVCDVNLDGQTKYNFYVLNVTGDTVTLIMKQNITQGTSKTGYTWMEASRYVYALNWKCKASLPDGNDVVNALNNNDFNIEYKTTNDWFCLGLKDQNSCRQGNYTYSTDEEKNAVVKYQWLFNYTFNCTNFGCDSSTSLDSGEAHGYWTNDFINESRNPLAAWGVFRNGFWGHSVNEGEEVGIRPTIMVLKSNLYE